ncbi:MAG: hypothetical protein IJF40_04115 [Clostridia bacterium]|nr:hypothetical protein [Clostridia bacterium]
MKRVFALFLSLLLITLSACSVQRFSDVKMFERRFNKQLVWAQIDSKEALITDSNDEIQYNFILSPDNKVQFLIRLYAKEDDLSIKRCSITTSATIQEMNSGALTNFREICNSVITIFSNGNDDPQKVSDMIFIPEPGSYTQAVPQYGETNFNRYTYSANNTGAFFCVENKSLCPETEPELTLRNYEGAGE